ncbi:MAG: isoleucine--tRNA ligase [Alphaproteobacteria bacterium]
MTIDYKSTVFLPTTEFPMRAGLPKREPLLLDRWNEMHLFNRQREISKGREQFVLHDGPPYANGNLHIGHALNKILKDVINRSQQMLGKDAHYIPGWDCHGLPIEWKVEEEYRAKGLNKDEVDLVEFRRQCREFADEWINTQLQEFKRLGVIGDWENYYTTMSFDAEATIAEELGKFAMNGGIYKGAKPVLWSIVERTALADAEVEYQEHTSHTVHVPFPVVTPGPASGLEVGIPIVIWTTTPWTLPSNRAVAYAADATYAVVRCLAGTDKLRIPIGQRFVVAPALLESTAKAARMTEWEVERELKGSDLAGTICAHPLRGHADADGFYDYDVPVHPADFVTMDTGSGFVHIAPSHGSDDYELGLAVGLPITDNVGPDGAFREHVGLFAGKRIMDDDGKEGEANRAVCEMLASIDSLYSWGRLKHSYPHSWRSKAPLIFRNTPQWFISMETNNLRENALKAIDETRFVPPAGQNRLRSMIETRPDWCVSRQRAWGVPIPLFVHKVTAEILRDQAVFDRVADAFRAEGGDAWYASPPERFLGEQYDSADYDQVQDIVEVWFDSGCTHVFTLEKRPHMKWPADLYLEGSDQHRGWFHSSLLESSGTRGRAPYDAVLTHGFVLDEHGKKMSKSDGNVTAPQEVIDQYGADILRIWVCSSDYSDDLRIGKEILKHQADHYRRVRNTLRFLLGSLDGFDQAESVDHADMPELERLVLHRLVEMDAIVRRCIDEFDFHTLWIELHNFCTNDLSAFYFDIRKDSLYCDQPTDISRRSCRTVLSHLFDALVSWLAPIACFTADEAYLTRKFGSIEAAPAGESIHLNTFPDIPAAWRDDTLATRWDTIRQVRRVITGALERERAEKTIRGSLEAAPAVYVTADQHAALQGQNLAEIAIVSAVELVAAEPPADAFTLPDVPGCGVVPSKADAARCERCWQHKEDIGKHAHHPDLCGRCVDAVGDVPAAA